MTSTYCRNAKSRAPSARWRAGSRVCAGFCAGVLLSICGCQGEPADLRDTGADVSLAEAVAELPVGEVIDLGIEARTHVMDGFSLPERIGPRLASWSEGERSTITLNLRGGDRDYLVAFLAEPYHRLGQVSVGLTLNQRPLGDLTMAGGWRGYQVVVRGERISAGRNELSFRYGQTGRPSDFDPASTDMRDLSVRFDQIQIQPITQQVSLAFGSKNALALAALADGWARDPSDRGTGTWTIDRRASLTFHLANGPAKAPSKLPATASSKAPPPGASASPTEPARYRVALSARTPRGVPERSVSLSLNGAPLGQLSFQEKRTTGTIEVSAERLKGQNELSLEFAELRSPAELDPQSKDKRLLGLRVFELEVAPLTVASKLEPALGLAVKDE